MSNRIYGQSYRHYRQARERLQKAIGSPSVAVIAVMIAVCLIPSAPLATFASADGLIGNLQQYQVRENESLVEIARKFDLGFNEIVDANPGVDPFIPAGGTRITIPTAWILPAVSRPATIVVNIPELRLYYVPDRANGEVATFPLGIGDEGVDTPVGSYTVIEKVSSPAWHVPPSIRRQQPALPRVVPPGPDNPMGSHALRLSVANLLIHGTNKPWGIGRRSSHGCLRLYPEDIVRLFKLVRKGARVVIVHQPIKVGVKGGEVFVEAHRYEGSEPSVEQAMQMFSDRGWLGRVDFSRLKVAMEEKRGMPIDVTLTR